MSVEYIWEKLGNPKLAQLREEFELEAVVRKGKSIFDKQLFLKEWLHSFIPQGTPEKDYYYESAFEILRDARAGKEMWCTQFAFAYLQCAQALGWQARKLSIDWDHDKETEDHHHGIVDIWSPEHKKWYVIDPLNNLHFTKKGVPLNAVEIRQEWLADRAQWMQGVVGNYKKDVMWPETATGFNTPSNYFWIFTSLRNNFMEQQGLFHTKGLLWIDEHNKDKRWYRGSGNEEKYEHRGYSGQFIETGDFEAVYPNLDK